MLRSQSFDRAVSYYDRTRELPEPVASAGMDAVLSLLRTRPDALLLEVGTGTGRIAIPLLKRGARLVGCDLSRPMLLRQREKFAEARLAQADAVRLPFAANQFDGLLTIHVLHLVGAWRAALREFRRVLAPGAPYVNSWNWHAGDSIDQRLRNYWRERVEAHGGAWRRPGIQSREELLEEVTHLGASVQEKVALTFTTQLSPQSFIDGIASRVYSDTWEVPDDVFAASLAEMRAWAASEYGDLNRPQQEEQRFLLDVVRFA